MDDRTPGRRPPPRFPLVAVSVVLGLSLLCVWLLWSGAPLPPSLDSALLRAMRDPADPARLLGPSWVVDTVRDLTALGSGVVTTGLAVVLAGALWLQRSRAAALFVLLLMAGAQVLVNALKLLVERARPDVVPHLAETVTHSFPSGHAMLAASVYPTLAVLLASRSRSRALARYFLVVALLVVLLVGVSRVVLGVHYPSDVLGGWALGGAWALAAWRVFQALGRT
ncbi:MAG: phosphatase PAP2 family protein [Myxococcaceae bacterium]|nr:phosphatase PAP2 family protein [Myxococcaceae bacterium]MCI0670683.1 phosphatase PAP2 family protein [Myxococcaceae bacterium]